MNNLFPISLDGVQHYRINHKLNEFSAVTIIYGYGDMSHHQYTFNKWNTEIS